MTLRDGASEADVVGKRMLMICWTDGGSESAPVINIVTSGDSGLLVTKKQ